MMNAIFSGVACTAAMIRSPSFSRSSSSVTTTISPRQRRRSLSRHARLRHATATPARSVEAVARRGNAGFPSRSFKIVSRHNIARAARRARLAMFRRLRCADRRRGGAAAVCRLTALPRCAASGQTAAPGGEARVRIKFGAAAGDLPLPPRRRRSFARGDRHRGGDEAQRRAARSGGSSGSSSSSSRSRPSASRSRARRRQVTHARRRSAWRPSGRAASAIRARIRWRAAR